jgi:hypothetical protein
LLEKVGNGMTGTDGDGIFGGNDLEAGREKGLQNRGNLFCGERGTVGEFHGGTDFELPGFEGGIVRPVVG